MMITLQRGSLALLWVALIALPGQAKQESPGGEGAASVTSGLKGVPAQPSAAPPESARVYYRVSIQLNGTGITDWSFLNPRRPAVLVEPHATRVIPAEPSSDEISSEQGILRQLVLVLQNRGDRPMTATFAIPNPGTRREDFENTYGVQLSEPCDPDAASTPCALSALVPENTSVELNAWMFIGGLDGKERQAALDSYLKGRAPHVFTVAFSEDPVQPANPRGYFYVLRPKVIRESNEPARWTVSALVATSSEPAFTTPSDVRDEPPVPISPEIPYGLGYRNQSFPASGALSVSRGLGSRAHALAELTYQKGALGGPATQLTASKFVFNVYAATGMRITFGRQEFAKPAGGIAATESGEGIAVAFRAMSATYLVKRESDAGTANRFNRDSTVLLLEARDLPGAGPLLSTSLFASRARDEAVVKTDSKYAQTYGLESQFLIARQLTARVAYFHSVDRHGTDTSADQFGSGHVGLMTATWHHYERRKSKAEIGALTSPEMGVAQDAAAQPAERRRLSVTGQFGIGSANSKDDAVFVGRTASFAPDALFLAMLAKALPEMKLMPSLAGKRYYAVALTSPRLSPLRAILDAIGVPRADMVNPETSLAVRHYELRGPHFGALEGASATELSTNTQIESPAGVTMFMRAAVLIPKGPLTALLSRNPWSVSAGILLKPF